MPSPREPVRYHSTHPIIRRGGWQIAQVHHVAPCCVIVSVFRCAGLVVRAALQGRPQVRDDYCEVLLVGPRALARRHSVPELDDHLCLLRALTVSPPSDGGKPALFAPSCLFAPFPCCCVVVRVFSTLLSEETPREISNKGTFSNIFSGRQNLVTTRESILEWGGGESRACNRRAPPPQQP